MKPMLLFIPLCLISGGCGDAIFYTGQSVTVAVQSRSTGEAAAGATVALARADGYSKEEGSEDAWIDRHIRKGSSGWKPDNQAVADSSGTARVEVNTSVLVGGWFTKETPLRDRLTGTEYFLRVKQQSDTEILRVKMKVGNKFEGQVVRGEIVNIGSPYDLEKPPEPKTEPAADIK